ncbi:hypothetical protein B0I00_1419 [Novosphingobium kunmingense]|uniref:HipA-like kinase domain-containing protein n=1 Tax=Novosphingobium kunmingense TaxID=1211806 RepID=A0A2N0HJY5_9SPHN|nr:HipA family kinase [Novosphingobium kunmingense]PKB19189.1 hypothetical protein B0I00_1419 [Novosphingobium kunmingense]
MSGKKLEALRLPKVGTGQNPILSSDFGSQKPMFPARLNTREFPPAGAHIALAGRADDGEFYFCKDDRSGQPIRLREFVFSSLAQEVGLPTPGFRVIEDDLTGETFFGSRRLPSTASDAAKKRFLRTERRDELGRHVDFPGRWLSQLHIFDMFLDNWDRSIDNIIALEDGSRLRLCPIDFAAAELANAPPDRFPVAETETVTVAKLLRIVHGFFPDSAHQMLTKIGAVPSAVFGSFFEGLPFEWTDQRERDSLCDFWASQRLGYRIDALRSKLDDGQVL